MYHMKAWCELAFHPCISSCWFARIDDNETRTLQSLVSTSPPISSADRIIVSNGDATIIVGGTNRNRYHCIYTRDFLDDYGVTATIHFIMVEAPVLHCTRSYLNKPGDNLWIEFHTRPTQ
jgi:hypothetical protein